MLYTVMSEKRLLLRGDKELKTGIPELLKPFHCWGWDNTPNPAHLPLPSVSTYPYLITRPQPEVVRPSREQAVHCTLGDVCGCPVDFASNIISCCHFYGELGDWSPSVVVRHTYKE